MANSQTVFLVSAVYAWPFIHCLYFIYERKIFGRTPRKNYATVEIHLNRMKRLMLHCEV